MIYHWHKFRFLDARWQQLRVSVTDGSLSYEYSFLLVGAANSLYLLCLFSLETNVWFNDNAAAGWRSTRMKIYSFFINTNQDFALNVSENQREIVWVNAFKIFKKIIISNNS